jgi:hypothetical protein
MDAVTNGDVDEQLTISEPHLLTSGLELPCITPQRPPKVESVTGSAPPSLPEAGAARRLRLTGRAGVRDSNGSPWLGRLLVPPSALTQMLSSVTVSSLH